jgi:hypothetical protein
MNNPGELVLSGFATLFLQLPEVLALVAGMVVALISWRRSGRTAKLALVAFVLAFAGLLLGVGGVVLAIWLQVGVGLSVIAASSIASAVYFLVNLLPAAAWLLIIMVLFGRGKEQLPAQG